MVDLARRRLEPFGDRVRVVQTDGSPKLSWPDSAYDRFVSTYVLDLLAAGDIRRLLQDARRLLRPGGRLCLVSLTHGETAPARLVERAWVWAHRKRPGMVGGCRPIALLEFVTPGWEVDRHAVLTSFAMSSEVVVARKAV